MTVIQAADKGRHLVPWQNDPYGYPAINDPYSTLENYRQKRNPPIIPHWEGKIRRHQHLNALLMNYRQNNFSSITTNQQGKVESSTPN